MPFKELQQLAEHAELTYAEGYPTDNSFQQALIDEAVVLAKAADVALLYVALPSFKESEGYDRADLDLTEQQVALIKAVAAIQPNTIVILNNGAPVTMSDWIDGPAAILEAWMMGQAGGGAIADVLFGRVNPSGKLAETYPLKLADTPAYLNFPGENGEVRYGEGLFIGYRYYDAKGVPVLFPFGYGLSYTTFAYSNPKVSAATFKDVDGLTVSVDVTNTGSRGGQRSGAGLRARSPIATGSSAQGTEGLCQSRTAAGRDQDGQHSARFPRLRLLRSGLPTVDHRRRRVRHLDRRFFG